MCTGITESYKIKKQKTQCHLSSGTAGAALEYPTAFTIHSRVSDTNIKGMRIQVLMGVSTDQIYVIGQLAEEGESIHGPSDFHLDFYDEYFPRPEKGLKTRFPKGKKKMSTLGPVNIRSYYIVLYLYKQGGK